MQYNVPFSHPLFPTRLALVAANSLPAWLELRFHFAVRVAGPETPHQVTNAVSLRN